jgi:hypothetical protein
VPERAKLESPQNSLDALRQASATSYYKGRDSLLGSSLAFCLRLLRVHRTFTNCGRNPVYQSGLTSNRQTRVGLSFHSDDLAAYANLNTANFL